MKSYKYKIPSPEMLERFGELMGDTKCGHEALVWKERRAVSPGGICSWDNGGVQVWIENSITYREVSVLRTDKHGDIKVTIYQSYGIGDYNKALHWCRGHLSLAECTGAYF